MDERLHPPLPHPRRDIHLRRARIIAAGALSLTHAAWFVAFAIAIERGQALTGPFAILGLAGLFLIALKAGAAGELALAIVDRRSGLESAPSRGEILRRAAHSLLIPLALLALAFSLRHNSTLMILTLALVPVWEITCKLLALGRWRTSPMPLSILKALLTGSPNDAMEELGKAPPLSTEEMESAALGVAGVAIRQQQPNALSRLEEFLSNRLEAGGEPKEEDDERLRRLLAVIRADHRRMVDPDNAAPIEAEALRLVPAGHPRRLALGLFVATAALDQDDPESAMKALRLLHSRDVIFSPARMLVNWLLMEAARQVEDTGLAERCRQALTTFNIERELPRLQFDNLRGAPDAYARWLLKAREALEKFPQ